MERPEELYIEDAKLLFLNFRGRVHDKNPLGHRTFSAIINPDDVNNLREVGWNVKEVKSRDEDLEPLFHLPVRISFENKPPRIFLTSTTKKWKRQLTEDQLHELDNAEINECSIIINPSVYSVNGSEGIKAYLKTMMVTIKEDPIQQKYNEMMLEIDDECLD